MPPEAGCVSNLVSVEGLEALGEVGGDESFSDEAGAVDAELVFAAPGVGGSFVSGEGLDVVLAEGLGLGGASGEDEGEQDEDYDGKVDVSDALVLPEEDEAAGELEGCE